MRKGHSRVKLRQEIIQQFPTAKKQKRGPQLDDKDSHISDITRQCIRLQKKRDNSKRTDADPSQTSQ